MQTQDLGHGWTACLEKTGGVEKLTIQNAAKGETIELGKESILTLRDIFERARIEPSVRKSGTVQCPHCKFGIFAEAIQQHIREKH